ncbi:MAG: hypothetical protein J7513_13885 [Solirubrobacteraceae bacterium]|nr:hypothetical protein [Solirubrobacteraceae bacterium]
MRLAVLVAATLALVVGAPSAAVAQKADPNVKTTVTDIQWRISYSVEVPGNCAVLGFSQWQASKFRGWDAYQVAVTLGTPPSSRTDSFPVSAAPTYDDQLGYGGNIVSPPAGSHWVLIGDGSYRAGPPPADPDCQAMLTRSQGVIPDGKVATSYRRTSTCTTKFDKLTKARKAVKKAKSKSAKSKANKQLSKAKRSFTKDCSE